MPDDDLILISDTSASALRKMTKANFVSGVGGLEVADQWRITANEAMTTTGDFSPNWERVDTSGQGYIAGSTMSESSGVFSFHPQAFTQFILMEHFTHLTMQQAQ